MPAVNIDAPAMTMPITMPLGVLTAGALLSGGLFSLPIVMAPGQVSAGALDSPPDDDDLGSDDDVYSEDGE